jgi:hypothetical protein
MLVALVAWARRRALKQREQAEEMKSRDLFDDEINDVRAPSEKSWWGSASISEGGMPLQIVASGNYNMAYPVPPLPSEFSPTSAATSKNPLLSDRDLTLPHPYAGTSFYSNGNMTRERNGSIGTVWSSSGRDAPRSPPNAPLPALPYKNAASTYFPPKRDGARVSSSSRPSSTASHPFASPPTNRKSALHPEDVLWGLGNDGGVGRSLSGRRAVEPPVPLIPADPFASGEMSPPNPTQSRLVHQTMVLQQLVDASRAHDKASPIESSRSTEGRKKKIPHDPRLSGLFGNVVADSRAESVSGLSEDQRPVMDEQEDHYIIHSHGSSGNRILRVCCSAQALSRSTHVFYSGGK